MGDGESCQRCLADILEKVIAGRINAHSTISFSATPKFYRKP